MRSFMFAFSESLLWVRKVSHLTRVTLSRRLTHAQLCRKGVMFFIRDPNDPSFKPVENIIEQPALGQARKIGTSLIMYVSLVWWFFGAAFWALSRVPSIGVLPLRISG